MHRSTAETQGTAGLGQGSLHGWDTPKNKGGTTRCWLGVWKNSPVVLATATKEQSHFPAKERGLDTAPAAQPQGWRRSWETSPGPSPVCLSQSLAGSGACSPTQQLQRHWHLRGIFPEVWRGFGFKDMSSQQQGRARELQTEPGKTGSAPWEEEEGHWGRAVPALAIVDEECCSWKARPPSKGESESWNQGRSMS